MSDAPKPPSRAADLDKLEASVNATSQKAALHWIAYLSLGAYLFFTTLSQTDRDLILLPPVKLPLIGVDLGLVAFFWAGPPLFWMFHLYLLRKLAVLSDVIAFYRAQMEKQVEEVSDRDALERRLDAFVITRLLGRSDATHPLHLLEWTIAVVTLVILPLVILLAFQIRFLAYHSEAATWWHRLWCLADLYLLLLALPRIFRRGVEGKKPASRWPVLSRLVPEIPDQRVIPAIGAGVFFTLFIATVPDEGITRVLRFPQLETDWFRNLEPSNVDFVDDEKLDKVQWTVDLRGRDLRNAKLSGADFRKARLDGAQLQGVKLDWGHLQGVPLSGEFRGVPLRGAQLQGASLLDARLQGASLDWAELQGASLDWAELQGASLDSAQLQGASLDWAQLQGASLGRAQLQGASLRGAQLQGASLVWAQLQGASLVGAEFQGASLVGAEFQGASLYRAEFWRAGVSENTRGDLIDVAVSSRGEPTSLFESYTDDWARWLVGRWLESIPSDGQRRGEAEKRFAWLLHGQPPDADAALQAWWAKVVDVRPDHGARLTDFLATLACAPSVDNAVAKGVVRRVRVNLTVSDVDLVRFAKHLLEPTCEGAKGLLAEDGALLRRAADGKASP